MPSEKQETDSGVKSDLEPRIVGRHGRGLCSQHRRAQGSQRSACLCRGEQELMDVQHAVRDMGAASMLCFPVLSLPGRSRTSSGVDPGAAAPSSEGDGTSETRSDSMGLDTCGREHVRGRSIRLQEGGIERQVGLEEAEQAYAARSPAPALGVLTLALPADVTMSRRYVVLFSRCFYAF